MVGGEPYALDQLRPITTATARQAVSTMIEWLGDTREFDNIVLVGGAADLFKAALKDAFPKHKVHEVRDPLYANVKGYHLAGLDLQRAQARQTPAAEEAATEGDSDASPSAAGEQATASGEPSATSEPPPAPIAPPSDRDRDDAAGRIKSETTS